MIVYEKKASIQNAIQTQCSLISRNIFSSPESQSPQPCCAIIVNQRVLLHDGHCVLTPISWINQGAARLQIISVIVI